MIHSMMDYATRNDVLVVPELSLDPLEIKQSWAIGEFVQHPGWNGGWGTGFLNTICRANNNAPKGYSNPLCP